MASKKIKGITVEIGGDTVGLEKALKDVNQRTIEVQSELKDVQRLLKFDPNNVELLAQKQELLSQAIQSSTEKLNQLSCGSIASRGTVPKRGNWRRTISGIS